MTEPMQIDVSLAPLQAIRPLRDLYRQEMNCQIIHDSLHERGFTDSYQIRISGRVAGYGTVLGFGTEPRDKIKEFYVLPVHRALALPLFRRFAAVSRAKTIEAQTNDVLLSQLLFDCGTDIQLEAVLFHDAHTTSLSISGVAFRPIAEADKGAIFSHAVEPIGEWMIEAGREVVATGGLLFHYNVPYGDIFMEVAEHHRRRGYGSYLVQELKRTCYEIGRIPAARCNPANVASRATLQKAGMLPCARVLSSRLAALPTTD